MLALAEEHLLAQNPDARLSLYGQEYNPQSYAICKSDPLAKGYDLTCDNLVRACRVVDRIDGLAQVVGDGVGGGDGVRSGLDLDGAVAAGCLDESAD